ncbi:C2 and GRAM domain-containing protein [Aureococcus anophagefferens]|nr:C2 and GRAM domain-containing protein [Aureococcus anophagefferens]
MPDPPPEGCACPRRAPAARPSEENIAHTALRSPGRDASTAVALSGRSTREDIEAYHASMLDDTEAEAAEEAAAVIFSGHLSKRGHVRATWKTRWFELREGAMVYFDSQGAPSAPCSGRRRPSCRAATSPTASSSPRRPRARCAEVEALGCRVHKSLFVECGTSKEKERWMSAVFAVINLQRGPSLAVKGLRDRHCAWEPDSSKARTLEQVDRERFANIISDGGKATTSDRELIFGEVMRGVEKCRAERPQLRVKVHAGRDLPCVGDANGLADPFAKVMLGGVVARTRTCPESLDPRWGEALTLDFDRESMRFLVVEVWDENATIRGPSEEFMGRLVLPLAALGPDVRVDRWFHLGRRSPRDRGSRGQIRLEIATNVPLLAGLSEALAHAAALPVFAEGPGRGLGLPLAGAEAVEDCASDVTLVCTAGDQGATAANDGVLLLTNHRLLFARDEYWRGSKRPGLTCHASLGAVTGAELRTKGGVDSEDRARVESVVIAARETECAAPERPLAGLAPDADEGPPSARIHARLEFWLANRPRLLERCATAAAAAIAGFTSTSSAAHAACPTSGTYDDDGDGDDGDDDEASDGTDDDDAEGGELTAYAAARASTRVPRLLKFGWDLFDAARELQRLGIPDGAWRVTAANEDYSLCPTYARVLAVPRSVDDASLRAGRA